MRLRRLPGVLMPHCPQCGAEMDTIVVIPHSREFLLSCEPCHMTIAGHPIQAFLRDHPEALEPDPRATAAAERILLDLDRMRAPILAGVGRGPSSR